MDIIGITTLLPYIGKYSITMFLVQKLNLLEKVAEYYDSFMQDNTKYLKKAT